MLACHEKRRSAQRGATGDGWDRTTSAEVIADGVHIHPAAVRLLARAKGPQRVVLIIDSIGPTGLPDGTYNMKDVQTFVSNGAAWLADGTLAGSTLTMDRGVANLVAFGAASFPEALAMGSYNAARVIGLDAQKGQIAAGMDTDLVGLDTDLQVQWTMVGGRMVYSRSVATGNFHPSA